jgi:CheY-like chemotaxis protein
MTERLNLSAQSPQALSRQLSTIRGAKILLVEDNEINQEVAQGLLAEGGLQVFVANDGQQALAMIHLHQWDLVLMDMYMPVMDGIAATQAIRLLDGFDTLPIIALTANARQSDLDRCLQSGMNDYVLKPINPDECAAELQLYLRNHGHQHRAIFGHARGRDSGVDGRWRRLHNRNSRYGLLVCRFHGRLREFLWHNSCVGWI